MSELQHERIVALEIAMTKAEAEIARLKEELVKCNAELQSSRAANGELIAERLSGELEEPVHVHFQYDAPVIVEHHVVRAPRGEVHHKITSSQRRDLEIDGKRGTITVTIVSTGETEVSRPLYGYELHLARELAKCMTDRYQDQHRLFHVEGIIEDQWRAGEEAVLAFVRNGRFLSDSAPGAQFAREVEAGWKSWGKAEADKARRAEINKAVAEHVEKSSLDTSRSSFGHEDDHP